MSALSELLARHTGLDEAQTSHLQRLVAEWQLLADLSFADLLLWVATSDKSAAPDAVSPGNNPQHADDAAGGAADAARVGDAAGAADAARAGDAAGSADATRAADADAEMLCVAQCRPTTGATAYLLDRVGDRLAGSRAMALNVARTEGRIFRESDPEWEGETPIRREAIPIVSDGQCIAVLGRDSNLTSVRSPSQLELAYLQSAADLASMVAAGHFPGPAIEREEAAGPRVGDGMVRVDADGQVLYASPNASSAFRRLGYTGNLVGASLAAAVAELARDPFAAKDLAAMVAEALAGINPSSLEIGGGGAIVAFRAIPLRAHGSSLGALMLMQDVTELRRRDRQILSKDATIREIHHRVKNNLQTVAALLRLQARRVANPEARSALEESMRRVSAIALVHETLSSAIEEEVDFDGVLARLIEMLIDVTGAGNRVLVHRISEFGELPAALATPLVMVLTELIGNAIEHGFPEATDTAPAGRGTVAIEPRRVRGVLEVAVSDDGVGLSPGFSLGRSDRLGLQIVRSLVDAELDGSLQVGPRSDGATGTQVLIRIPLTPAPVGGMDYQ